MGQQQLLLLVLGAIIVGVAIVVGVNMFSSSAVNANRDAVVQDCMTLATRAQQWYRTPVILGGGGRDFTNAPAGGNGLLDAIRFSPTNENGSFGIVVTDASTITITGTGLEPNPDNALTVVVVVTPDAIQTPTITIPE